jgi:low temperature requirement protein LtrA
MSAAQSARPLRLRTAEDAEVERHASWLELFFDLVFVVAVAELGETLAREPSATGFVHYGALFVPVWWAWVGYTFYADRFDVEDLPYRLALLAAMLAIAAVAVSVPRAFASPGGAQAFAASYVGVRAVLIGLYVRAHRRVPLARPLTARYAAGFLIGAGLWAVSIAVPAPLRWWLWGAGMTVELVTPLLSSSAIRRVPYNVSHIPERFGLFTIIVLGQSVAVGVIATARQEHLHAGAALVAAGAFVLAAAVWWVYFEFADSSPLRNWLIAGQTWMYGHLLVFAGITASGEGALLAVRATGNHPLAAGGRWALCAGLAAFLLALALIRAANARRLRDFTAGSRLVGSGTFVVLGAAGAGLSPAALVYAALVPLLAVVAVESAIRRAGHRSAAERAGD